LTNKRHQLVISTIKLLSSNMRLPYDKQAKHRSRLSVSRSCAIPVVAEERYPAVMTYYFIDSININKHIVVSCRLDYVPEYVARDRRICKLRCRWIALRCWLYSAALWLGWLRNSAVQQTVLDRYFRFKQIQDGGRCHLGKISNGHISATGRPIHFMFG